MIRVSLLVPIFVFVCHLKRPLPRIRRVVIVAAFAPAVGDSRNRHGGGLAIKLTFFGRLDNRLG
jgi:hypothetical protein